MSKQEDHAQLIVAGMEDYENAFIAGMGEMIEGGEVIGVPSVSKRTLRAFFDQVTPQEWLAATIEDPEGALGMLTEYAEAST